MGNADGPDGELNGVVAYNEDEGIKGGTVEFGSEIWNGQQDSYVTESSIEQEIEGQGGCPGETIRCVASVDLRTVQSGWGIDSSNSYEVNIE